jgi:hypothetical protein
MNQSEQTDKQATSQTIRQNGLTMQKKRDEVSTFEAKPCRTPAESDDGFVARE